MANLRVIRFLIYFSTLAYAVVILIQGPSDRTDLGSGPLLTPTAGAIFGVAQLLAVLVGLVVDSVDRKHSWLLKPVFLVLTLGFLYSTVLEIIVGESAFAWIPFLLYTALCSVVYLQEGQHNEG